MVQVVRAAVAAAAGLDIDITVVPYLGAVNEMFLTDCQVDDDRTR